MAEPSTAPRLPLPPSRFRTRRWLLLAVASVVALLLAGTATIVLTSGDDPADRPTGTPGDPPPGSTTQSAPVVSRSPTGAGGLTVRYGFDGGLEGAVFDDGRQLPLRVSVAAGGQLTGERRDGGLAVRFPATCPNYGDKSCPRAVLESAAAEVLNPGTGPLRFGAAVRLAPEETAKGENVLQKGYSQGDSQFKLQIDGPAGRPGCVLVGTGSPEIHVLIATTSVADGRWHVVECARTADALSITVDGAVAGRRNVPADLSIVNKEPLRIGGKGTGPNNDQFHGAVDDVSVTIGT